MRRYLHLLPLEKAIALLEESFPHAAQSREIPVTEATGRVTAAPVYASYSVPEAPLAAMDGIAVRSADTRGASEQSPVLLREAIRVNTGNVVPPPFDAVIMIEEVWEQDGGYLVRRSVPPWQHIRPVGEDIGEGEMILASRHRLEPHDIAALLSFGVASVQVLHMRVGLIATGSEIVPPGTKPKPGQVVESNTYLAEGWLRRMGVETRRYDCVPDDPSAIAGALARSTKENDMTIVTAGSSAGTRDYTAEAIGSLGRVLAHGIAIKPGKPAIIGEIARKPVIGLPGYPLSALVVLMGLVTPYLASLGFTAPAASKVRATLARGVSSEIGVEEFVFVACGRVDGRWIAFPLTRGAGVQMSAVRSNGCMKVPAAVEGYPAGEEVEISLWKAQEEVSGGLLLVGSHDPALDHLAALLAERGVAMHAINAGSMGGLLALKAGYCHAAPVHLLAPDGSYNIHHARRYLQGGEVILLAIAGRQQGIASREGISLEELPRHRFVNRQKGSGTRILLDHLLGEEGIDPASIPGYEREMTTHLAVARAVANGEADACVCTLAAARIFDLKFVPLAMEEYELAIRHDALQEREMRMLCDCIVSEEFRRILEGMGGYDTSLTGRMRRV